MTVLYGYTSQAASRQGSPVVSHRPIILAAAALSLALGACATVPHLDAAPRPRAISTLAAAESFKAPTGDWPADRWWTAYGDAQLDGLVDEALAGSPGLAQAEARLRGAQAAAERSGASLLPQLSGAASAAETKQSYNNGIPPAFVPHGYHDYGKAALDLSWDLDLWGRNRAAVAASVSEVEAARLDAAQVRLMLTSSVVAAYADLTRLFAEREADLTAAANRHSTVQLVVQRVVGGAANQGEASQAQSAEAAAQQELAEIDEQIAVARHRLAVLVGAGPDRGLAITRPAKIAQMAFSLPANLAVDLVGRRPDVQAARARAEAAAKRIKVARAGFYPNINLAGFIGYQSLGLDMLTRPGSDIGQAGAAISLPIFTGGRLEGAYRGARADYDAAVAAYDQTLVQALQEVADAAAGERSLQVRLAQARRSLAAAEDAYRIAGLRYKAGLSSYLTVLSTEDAAIAQRRAVAGLEARALSLDAQLVRALGGGFRPA
jgi:NodT family efflux transporter outer membrane factor (OMF) lipoprotein